MKRLSLTLYIVAALLLLSGCEGNLFSSHRDMERLRPVQTIGLDRQGEGVMMSVSSGIGPEEKPPLVMQCAASGIEAAISRLQSYSPEDELYYAHVQYLLLGESMTSGSILPILDWVERSPSMRMDMALLIVKGSAGDTVTAATGETTDITERLASLEREEAARGQHIYALREVATALLERGSALCLAIQPVTSDGTIYTESEASDAILPAGYAVLRDGAETAYLTQDETLGAQLLLSGVNGAHIPVGDAMLELLTGSAEAAGQWDDGGTLTGIVVHCKLRAGVLERENGGGEDVGTLQNDFSAAAKGWLEAVVARSQALDCDFLDLESSVMKNAPGRDAAEGWSELFPTLPVAVYAEGEIDRSYDLSS